MDTGQLVKNRQRLEANRAYSAKLSWKRKQTLEMRRQINEFIEANFEINLPGTHNQFKRYSEGSDIYNFIRQEYGELINAYYVLGNFGESIGSLFETETGPDIFTNAHLFSKHRIDPTWNWKKSKLIRNVYYNFLQQTKIYKDYTPAHITLTLPHSGGTYCGKSFYAKELIEEFNLIRKSSWWKKYVYAGEYGIEVTGNEKNGLHIHLHSLAFLKVKNLSKFREKLKEVWHKETGASQIWVESLYIYKKDDSGAFITEMVDNSKLLTYEQDDGTYTSVPDGKIVRRKKFYLSDEVSRINKSDLDDVGKEREILELHTKAILETIKYHFKNDSIMLDSRNYNIFLINEILKNTKGKRLYSRFGKFYKEPLLNFNRFEDEDVTMNEANSDTVINPVTMEEVKIEDTEVIIFQPEQLTYRGKNSKRPFTVSDVSRFEPMKVNIKSIKELLKILIKSKFG